MPTTVAILLSCPSFEAFFGKVLSLTVEDYLLHYRNDFSWYYMEMFRDAGLRPILYIPSLTTSGLRTTDDGFEVRFLPLSPVSKTLTGLNIWRGKVGRYIAGVINAYGFLTPLLEALKTDKVDVVYEQEYWHARFDVLSRNLLNKVALVAADHGAIERENLSLFKKRSLAQALALTSQSEEEAATVERYGLTPWVVPNPVSTDYYAPRPSGAKADAEQKTVLTVARLTDRVKRTSDLIEAMQYLGPTWRLKIAGSGPDRAMLEDRVSSLGLTDRVEFLGFVRSKAAVRELYWTSDVFCMPSVREGLAMVALEAMGSGVPVVLTPVPAFKALIQHGENGILTPIGDTRKLAASIEEADANRAKLVANARKTIVDVYSRAAYMKFFTEEILEKLPSARTEPVC